MLLTLGEEKWVLVALTRVCTRLFVGDVDWYLLPEKSLLCIKLVLFVLHRVVSLLPKNAGTWAWICLWLSRAEVLTDLVKLKLIGNSLTNQVFQLVDVS